MTTITAKSNLNGIGYRRLILLVGAFWGAAPALSFGFNSVSTGLSSTEGLLAMGAVMTLSLGVLYELDSRQLEKHGQGVHVAWTYALVAPIAVVGVPDVGLLIGPPLSALLYVWQRGRAASVR